MFVSNSHILYSFLHHYNIESVSSSLPGVQTGADVQTSTERLDHNNFS